MPIYEYQCQKCGEVFEVMQKVSDPPPKRHTCGSRRVKRVMSQTSFILKGSGWYVTDYARKGKNGDGNGEGNKSKPKKKDGGSSSKSSTESSTSKKTAST